MKAVPIATMSSLRGWSNWDWKKVNLWINSNSGRFNGLDWVGVTGINSSLFTCCWGEGVEDAEGGGRVEPTSSETTDEGDNAHDAADPIVVDIDGFGDGVTYPLDGME